MTPAIYLDNNSAARPSELTVSRMIPFYTENWASPVSPHRMGQRLWPSIEEAYRSLYSLLGAPEADTLLFFGSGAEAVNQLLKGVFFSISRTTGKNHFATSSVDEAPAILTLGQLEQLGAVSGSIPVNSEGYVTAEAVGDALTPRTAMVSLSWANGLTGVVNPVAEIAKVCRQRGVLLHLEATHVLGKLYFDLAEIEADFITFNGEQLHGPRGSGGLYMRAGAKLPSLFYGGASQPLNVAGLVGLGQAAKEALDSRDLLCMEVARLRNRLEEGICQAYPEAILFFRKQPRLPNTAVIAFPGISSEAMLYALNRQNVYATMGGGNFQQIGLVLAASDVSEQICPTALSFSLARTIHEEEVDRAIEIIAKTAAKLRKFSEHIVRLP